MNFNDDYWEDLPTAIQKAANVLGYTQEAWDRDQDPPTLHKNWDELNEEERVAATLLGYDESAWQEEEEDDNRPNLVCLQLFVETDDYRLKVKPDVGLSMFTNRQLNADEWLLKSPVGPLDTNQRLMRVSSNEEGLTEERQGFMERFLSWQKQYGSKTAPGASSCARPRFDESDFARKGRKVLAEPVTPSSPSYYFEMCPSDFVLVEFIPNQAPHNSSLPSERQFEVLPYDEAIAWEGEDGYDPSKHKRPPILDCWERELELPGHFTNHACGDSATMYDNFRLRRSDDPSGSCPLVAPALPPANQGHLDRYVQTRVFQFEFAERMTSHRAMAAGEEVLTDYSLWHWSNEDYAVVTPYNDKSWKNIPEHVQAAARVLGYTPTTWDEHHDPLGELMWMELSKEQRRAAKTLGYSQLTWDAEDEDVEEPWFHCVCGDSKCHSSGGFRGVKYFPREEQERLYWICSTWIQNQIDWKRYQLEASK